MSMALSANSRRKARSFLANRPELEKRFCLLFLIEKCLFSDISSSVLEMFNEETMTTIKGNTSWPSFHLFQYCSFFNFVTILFVSLSFSAFLLFVLKRFVVQNKINLYLKII